MNVSDRLLVFAALLCGVLGTVCHVAAQASAGSFGLVQAVHLQGNLKEMR